MTSNPDPTPEDTAGLEPGGGVPPGETPPSAGSVDAGTTPPGPGRRTLTPWLVLGLIGLLLGAFLVLYVVKALSY